jgi:hypothetical protein
LRGPDINTQLAQARELEAKLAEEYRAVRLLRASIVRKASARGERARELGKQARERINVDFDVDNPNTPPRASQKLVAAVTLRQAMPAPSTIEVRNLHREAQALIEQVAVKPAESSASRIHQQRSTRDDGGAQGPEMSVHAGGAAERPANPGRTLVRERILDTRGQALHGDARNVINARRTGNMETWAATGYHPSSSARRTRTSGCALTTPISTSTAPRTPSGCPNRSSHRLYGGLRPALLPRLLLRVPPDRDQGRRP